MALIIINGVVAMVIGALLPISTMNYSGPYADEKETWITPAGMVLIAKSDHQVLLSKDAMFYNIYTKSHSVYEIVYIYHANSYVFRKYL